MGNDKKKKERAESPLDIWPPPEKPQEDPRRDRLKPRNTSYIDPIEDIEHTDTPVYDITPQVDEKDVEKEEEDRDEKDNKDEK